MRVTNKVGVEVVHVGALDATAVAPPGVGVAVEAAVEKVQGLVGEGDAAMATLPIALVILYIVVVVVVFVVASSLDDPHWTGRRGSCSFPVGRGFPAVEVNDFRFRLIPLLLLLSSDAQVFGLILIIRLEFEKFYYRLLSCLINFKIFNSILEKGSSTSYLEWGNLASFLFPKLEGTLNEKVSNIGNFSPLFPIMAQIKVRRHFLIRNIFLPDFPQIVRF
jgi:hypothetical protein